MNSLQPSHHCLLTNVIKKGMIRDKKGYQRYQYKDCRRTFVPNGNRWFVSPEERGFIDRLLLERLATGHLPDRAGEPALAVDLRAPAL